MFQIYSVYACMYVWACAEVRGCHLMGVSSFYYMSLKFKEVIRLSGRCLYLLSFLAGPNRFYGFLFCDMSLGNIAETLNDVSSFTR